MSSVAEMIREHIRAVNSIQTCTLIVPSIILLEVSSFCDFFVTDTTAHLRSLTSGSAQFIWSRFPRESPLSKFDGSLLGLNFLTFENELVSNSECVSGEEVGQCRDFFSLSCGFAPKKVLGSQPS
jgi:hypothetical protein